MGGLEERGGVGRRSIRRSIRKSIRGGGEWKGGRSWKVRKWEKNMVEEKVVGR